MATTRTTNAVMAGCLLALLASAEARANNFADVRLTVTFGDDDVFTEAGELVPDSPLPGFGDRPGYELFYDNLNTRYSGRESLAHLVLYRKLPAFFDNVTTEAAMFVLLQLTHSLKDVSFTDTGSYIRIAWHPWGGEREGLSLTAMPFDSDRMRMGYLYRLSVGGNDFYPRMQFIGAPGVKLQFVRGPGSYYLGFKAAPMEVAREATDSATTTTVHETHYSVLGGASWDGLAELLRLDLGLGFFQQGGINIRSEQDGEAFSFGGSARVALHRNLPVDDSIDYLLYTNDPNRPMRLFAPVEYVPGRLGYMVSLEGVVLGQQLGSAVTFGETTLQPAWAAALRGRLQLGYWRLELTAMAQDVAFISRGAPGFPPYQAFDDDAELSPELMFSLASDYHFPLQRLTLGASAGVLLPATIKTTLYAQSGSSLRPVGTFTMIIGDYSGMSILPEGVGASPLLNARVHLRWDVSRMLYTQVWSQFVWDPNAVRLKINPNLTQTRIEQDSFRLGFGVSAAVRF